MAPVSSGSLVKTSEDRSPQPATEARPAAPAAQAMAGQEQPLAGLKLEMVIRKSSLIHIFHFSCLVG